MHLRDFIQFLNTVTASDIVVVLGLVLGIGFAILSLVGLPFGTNPSWKEKAFWSLVLFLVTTGASFGLKTLATMSDEIKSISPPPDIAAFLQTYQENIYQPNPSFHDWITGSFDAMVKNLKEGFVDMPVSKAPDEIGQQYARAQEYIVATNVGSLNAYFGSNSGTYESENSNAFEKGVPVVRYFIFRKNMPILRENHLITTFEEFSRGAVEVSANCKTPFAEAIDISDYGNTFPDVIFTDAPFFAETQLDQYWTAVSAMATDKISDRTRNDFGAIIDLLQSNYGRDCDVIKIGTDSSLASGHTCHFVEMQDADIRNNERLIANLGFESIASKPGQPLAECIETEVMLKVRGVVNARLNLDSRRFHKCLGS